MWHEALDFLGTGMIVVVLKRGEYRLGQGEVDKDCEYACQLFCAYSENASWNIGLAGVDLIKDPSYVSLGEQDHPVLWVGDGPHTRLNVVAVQACIKCFEFVS